MTSRRPCPSTPRRRPPPQVGPARPAGRLTYRHRGRTVLAWVAALGWRSCLAAAFGGEFKADYSAPGSDSSEAQQLLEDEFPAQSGDTVDVVVHADGGRRRPPQARRRGRCSPTWPQVPHVAARRRPVRDARRDLPRRPHPGRAPAPRRRQPRRHAGRGQRADARARRRRVHGRRSRSPSAGRPSSRPSRARSAPRPSGSRAAAIILLLIFGSVVAAGLPILVAVAGLAVSSTLTTVAHLLHRRARLVDLAGHDDGHRHRHRLRAADGHPVPRVAGRRARPARPRRSPPSTPRAARSWSPAARW